MPVSFNEFFGDDWRDKIVTHKTPTGRTSRVKVGSLPPEEQLKYNPNRFKRGKKDTRMTKGDYDDTQKQTDKKIRIFDVYLGTKNMDILDIQEDSLVLATTDSELVINLFDDDLDVVSIKGLPVAAIKKYYDGDIEDIDSFEDSDFVSVEDEDNEEKLYELAKFSDAKIFLIDLYPYLESLDIKIDTASDDEDDFDELKKEDFNFLKFVKTEEDE